MTARRTALASMAAAGAVLLAACGGTSAGDSSSARALSSPPPASAAAPAGIPADFSMLPPDDFSGLDRVAAFTALHERVSKDYAFTEWKGLDLDSIYQAVLPAVQAAAAADDAEAFLLALRQYGAAFEDGHVRVAETTEGKPLTSALTIAQSGGSVGLGLLRLDDGRVVVAAVTPKGQAAKAGITAGDVVTSWGGQPVDEAAAAIDVATTVDAPAVSTDEYRALEQLRLLTRMPVGTTIEVGIEGSAAPVALTAVDDQGDGLHLVDIAHPLTAKQEKAFAPDVRTLDDGVGYVQIGWLADLADLAAYPQSIADGFAAAIEQFADAPGIVIDLRANHGGSDQLAADLCGHFLEEPQFYERLQVFDATNRNWVTLAIDSRTGQPIDALMATPQQPRYAGPVVVLANSRTISSGEGLAQCLGSLPQGVSVGMSGTRAAFGLANGEVPMPDGLVFHYPNGRTVDSDGAVQLDSRQGAGGVLPEVRVPITMDTALAFGRGADVELEAALAALRSS